MEKVYKVIDLPELTGLSITSIRYFIRIGKIKAVKVGKNYVIAESEIRRIQKEGIK